MTLQLQYRKYLELIRITLSLLPRNPKVSLGPFCLLSLSLSLSLSLYLPLSLPPRIAHNNRGSGN